VKTRLSRVLVPFLPLALVLLAASAARPQSADVVFEDDFGSFETLDDSELVSSVEELEAGHQGTGSGLRVALGALLLTALAGILARFKATRPLRPLVLLGSLITLGFVLGGCPCPISSLQNLILKIMGKQVCGYSLVWFLGLIPLTYLFGRVWCGWVCHLGALQEFLHASGRLSFLKSDSVRRFMKVTQYVLAGVLVVQLVLTRENLFVHVDPFKVAFNLTSYYTSGCVLLGLLLVASVYVYRPFCRSVCPVGLVLAWTARIPGAAVLARGHNCRPCRSCRSACPTQAISPDLTLDSSDCFACGACQDACSRAAISYGRGHSKRPAVAGPVEDRPAARVVEILPLLSESSTPSSSGRELNR